MSVYLNKDIGFLKVAITEIPEKILRLLSTAILRDWTKYPEYITRRPNPRELVLFITRAKAQLAKIVNANVSFEEMGVQRGIAPEWDGMICKVGDEALDYTDVPHDPVHQLKPANARIAVQATMLLRSTDDGVLPVLAPSVIKDGPLGAFHTDNSYAEYGYAMGEYLTEKKVTGSKPEAFARAVYATIAKETPGEIAALRQITYNSYGQAKLSFDEKTGLLCKESAFEMTSQGISRTSSGMAVPALTFTKYTGQIKLSSTSSLEKEKDPVIVLTSFLNSRLPPNLVKYYGYRGFPGKNQRKFFEVRPFLKGAVLVDPDVMMRKWCEANGLGDSIRTAGNLAVASTVGENDIPLFCAEYTDKFEAKRAALFYGPIKFSTKFWEKYDVLMYRPMIEGRYFFTQKTTDLSLPDKHCNWSLQRLRGSTEMVRALSQHAGALLGCYYRATYAPMPGLYAGLKYPVDEVSYEKVTMTEITEADRQLAASVAKTTMSSFSVTREIYEDSVSPSSYTHTNLKTTTTMAVVKPPLEKDKEEEEESDDQFEEISMKELIAGNADFYDHVRDNVDIIGTDYLLANADDVAAGITNGWATIGFEGSDQEYAAVANIIAKDGRSMKVAFVSADRTATLLRDGKKPGDVLAGLAVDMSDY